MVGATFVAHNQQIIYSSEKVTALLGFNNFSIYALNFWDTSTWSENEIQGYTCFLQK